MFEIVLNFYRHGKIIIPSNRSAEMVKEELDFFGINVEECTDGLGKPHDKDPRVLTSFP